MAEKKDLETKTTKIPGIFETFPSAVKVVSAGTPVPIKLQDVRIKFGRGLLSVLTQIPGTNNESRNGGLSIDGASVSSMTAAKSFRGSYPGFEYRLGAMLSVDVVAKNSV